MDFMVMIKPTFKLSEKCGEIFNLFVISTMSILSAIFKNVIGVEPILELMMEIRKNNILMQKPLKDKE